MNKVEYIYFQTTGMRQELCEIGMITENDKDYIWYLNEPCKILKTEVLIIPEDKVTFIKKSRELRINKNYIQSSIYQTERSKLYNKLNNNE